MTYRDGVGVERCSSCHAPLRNLGDAPVVSVLLADVEEIACILEQYVDCPEVWGDTIKRLEQAAGRTVAQMSAAPRPRR